MIPDKEPPPPPWQRSMVIEKTDFRDARMIDDGSLVTELRAPIITPPSVHHEVTRMTRYRGQRAFSNTRERGLPRI